MRSERELSVTATSRLNGRHAEALHATTLDDLAISDLIHGAAFFNWEN